jgi:hypothetical protein
LPPPPPAPPVPPPQPTAPPTRENNSKIIPKALVHLRRRPTSSTHASAAQLADAPKDRTEPLTDGVVCTARVVVTAPVLLIATEPGMLHVAGSFAAVGVIAQVRLTAPVNPSAGVSVIVEVFPVVAPRVTLMFVPVIEKLGCANRVGRRRHRALNVAVGDGDRIQRLGRRDGNGSAVCC